MKLVHLTLFIAFICPAVALASAAEYTNIRMHCAILKNNQLIKQQNCVAETGYVHANGYGAGSGYSFKPISGYGRISVDSSMNAVNDRNGNPIIDRDGSTRMTSSDSMNDKDAIVRYRMPNTFKLLTPAQEEQYHNGQSRVTPYTCFIHKQNPRFEFCFSKPLPG